jgi:hypothetical protein
MVFISHFCYFIFIPKLCTVPLWFLCIDGLYTFVGFQGYQVVYFLSNLQDQYNFCDLNFKFKSILTQLTGGLADLLRGNVLLGDTDLLKPSNSSRRI